MKPPFFIIRDRLLPALLFLLTFSGCSKDRNTPNRMKATVDGVSIECNTGFRATKGAAGNKTLFFEAGNSQYLFHFYINEQGPDIVPGTYDFVSGIERNTTLREGNDAYSAGYFFCLGGPCNLNGSGRITITEIDKKHISGGFEFITAVNAMNGKFKTVTGGEFWINRD